MLQEIYYRVCTVACQNHLVLSHMMLSHLLQAFGVARQMLSLVAGSAIDEYLLSQLRLLRQPHTLARLIHTLQTHLWPGGVWFQHTAKYMQQHPVSSLSIINLSTQTLLLRKLLMIASYCNDSLYAARSQVFCTKLIVLMLTVRKCACSHHCCSW